MEKSTKDALAWLDHRGAQKNIQDLQRYGITVERAFGVTVGDLKKYAKQVGTDHVLARELWASGWYEARLLAAFVGDARQVTVRQMEEWANDFDNWAVVDTVCFSLFDRTPHAWKMVAKWAGAKPEFKKRAAFALIWSLSVHDKAAPDKAFLDALRLIEEGANDERHFVKKAVNMALRATGKRNAALRAAAVRTAERLAGSSEAAPRWVGKDALRELTSAGAVRRARSADKR